MAHSTQGGLLIQRSWLDGVGRKLQGAAERFPAINQIMMRVRLRRRRDSLICLALVAILIFIVYLSVHRHH